MWLLFYAEQVALFPSCIHALQRAWHGFRHTISLDVHGFYPTYADRKLAQDALHSKDFKWEVRNVLR